jgi:hypothetical protein
MTAETVLYYFLNSCLLQMTTDNFLDDLKNKRYQDLMCDQDRLLQSWWRHFLKFSENIVHVQFGWRRWRQFGEDLVLPWKCPGPQGGWCIDDTFLNEVSPTFGPSSHVQAQTENEHKNHGFFLLLKAELWIRIDLMQIWIWNQHFLYLRIWIRIRFQDKMPIRIRIQIQIQGVDDQTMEKMYS